MPCTSGILHKQQCMCIAAPPVVWLFSSLCYAIHALSCFVGAGSSTGCGVTESHGVMLCGAAKAALNLQMGPFDCEGAQLPSYNLKVTLTFYQPPLCLVHAHRG